MRTSLLFLCQKTLQLIFNRIPGILQAQMF